MNGLRIGRPFPLAVLFACVLAGQASAGGLEVVDDEAAVLLRLDVRDGEEWCLHWNHSVTGGSVADCFEIRDSRLILTRSYLHDYAAGLGDIPGRGVQRAAEGGGYWIEEMDEPVPDNRLLLRVGSARVDHRIVWSDGDVSLSELAAGQRVRLRPARDAGSENPDS